MAALFQAMYWWGVSHGRQLWCQEASWWAGAEGFDCICVTLWFFRINIASSKHLESKISRPTLDSIPSLCTRGTRGSLNAAVVKFESCLSHRLETRSVAVWRGKRKGLMLSLLMDGRWRPSTYFGSLLGTARESFLFEICLRRHCLKGCKTQPETKWSFRTKRKSLHGWPLGFAEPLIGNAIRTSLVLFGDHLVYRQFLILDEVKQMYDTPTCICI